MSRYRAQLKRLNPGNADGDKAIQLLVNHFEEVRKEFIYLEKTISPTTQQLAASVVAAVASGSTTTPATSAATVQVATVVAGAQTVTLSTSMSLSNWVAIICYMFSANGSRIDLIDAITNQTTNTFDINCSEAGILFFSAAPRT